MEDPKRSNQQPSQDCTLAYIRFLTRPIVDPPASSELHNVFLDPWNVKIPVNTKDPTTFSHWRDQAHTELFHQMFEWDELIKNKPKVTLPPFFSFGNSKDLFFFQPWQDVGNCLKNLLLHQLASHQTGTSITLSSHNKDLFIATAHNFQQKDLEVQRISNEHFLLRCHHRKGSGEQILIFGYHDGREEPEKFHELHVVSLNDENWRLTTCIVLKNLARIIHVLKDFAIPLTCAPKKRMLIQNGSAIQKMYSCNEICGIFQATVSNMIEIYEKLQDNNVPHTDRLIMMKQQTEDDSHTQTICQFQPVGRSYLPENCAELLDALVCVAEALTKLHALGIMHRDIRWANVFHAFVDPDKKLFSNKWVLFDFEFAGYSPQSPFAFHTLVPENHAPEMLLHEEHEDAEPHTTAVDIWGLGYLIRHCHVDLPASHAADVTKLKDQCLQENPADRPTTQECLATLRGLQARSISTEKDVKR